MSLEAIAPQIYRGALDPAVGELAATLKGFSSEVIIGHPTFRNADNIGRQLRSGIAGAAEHFAGRRVSFIVSDGSYNASINDRETIEAALAAAREALAALEPAARANIQVIVAPYDGYAGNYVPGKGSALKMIFEEMGGCDAELLVLLDGDLRNDMAEWQRVFAAVEAAHAREHGDAPFFITARYARHFVDASLTRFIVGPLTTLMGRYVPGGISGDIVLSAPAVALERKGQWTEERMRYGTDISTTFDNIAANTVIYEVYLGAKLHDITDEGKLSVMPAEVIGAALERLLHWEAKDGRIGARLGDESAVLQPLMVWGPDKTGIDFVDPGRTDAFDVDVKIASLLDRYADFREAILEVQGATFCSELEQKLEQLRALRSAGKGPLRLLEMDSEAWIAALQRAVAYALVNKQVEAPKRCLNYLYTAAFLQFVRDKLAALGLERVEDIREAQKKLGVDPKAAERFYREEVDAEVDKLALDFYAQRGGILAAMRALGSQ